MGNLTQKVATKLTRNSSSPRNDDRIECIDLKIFTNPNSECRPPAHDQLLTKCCSPLLRLCTASRYFKTLNDSPALTEEMKKAFFVQFCQETYGSLLDDTAHLIEAHGVDITRIRKEWIDRYGLKKCEVSGCIKTARHYQRGQRQIVPKQNENEHDALYEFYESEFDKVHNFVFHLYDLGLRVDISTLNLNEEDADEKQTEFKRVKVDKLFAAEQKHIKMRRKESNVNSERMNSENNKYTMQMTATKKCSITLMDALFAKIAKLKEVQTETVQQMKVYFDDNLYDSDCIEMDIEDLDDSNIYSIVPSQRAVESMKKLVRITKLREREFSTGFEFQYGSQWKGFDDFYVAPKHSNLKEEIIASGHLGMAKWIKIVVLKGEQYWNTRSVRKMAKYGLKQNNYKLCMDHLFAIILYCDFTVLCTAFSETYRRENVFESVESVISRHSEFAHFGKLLKKVVNGFGIDRLRGYNGHESGEKGPFFCGINCELNIGSFAITLKGPCSTSTVRTVAINFATEKGMILEIDNDSGRRGCDGWSQSCFDCSWISSYSEESERLWICGDAEGSLRIESIVIVRTKRSYQNAMRALYLFDSMISGICQNDERKGGIKSNESDYELISNLMEWTLNGGDSGSSGFDSFIENEWNLFLQNKTVIKLRPEYMNECYQSLSKLVMFSVKDIGDDDEVNGNENVLRPEWISMFPSVNMIEIETYNADRNQFKFRLETLLGSMKNISQGVSVTVRDSKHENEQWIKDALTNEISEAFDSAGWSIEYNWRLVIKSKKK